MAEKDKLLHMLGELGALILVNPFLIYLLYTYNFKQRDSILILLLIITTFIIDGYLLLSWFI